MGIIRGYQTSHDFWFGKINCSPSLAEITHAAPLRNKSKLYAGAQKMLDVKLTDQLAGHEIAGHENAGMK